MLEPLRFGADVFAVTTALGAGLATSGLILRFAFSDEMSLWIEAARTVLATRTFRRRAARLAALADTRDGGASS